MASGLWIAVFGVFWLSQEVSRTPLPSAFLWIVLGAALASIPWTVVLVLAPADGSASWRLGADAEEWTASALRRLGNSWAIEHNVPFAREWGDGELDVDHVAVGPYGVLVVETKFCSGPIDLSTNQLPQRVRAAVRQAEQNRGRVVAALGKDLASVPIVPLVIFWGRRVAPPDDVVRRVGDVRIVRGSDAKAWTARMGTERLEESQRLAVIDRVRTVADRYRRSADPPDLTRRVRVLAWFNGEE